MLLASVGAQRAVRGARAGSQRSAEASLTWEVGEVSWGRKESVERAFQIVWRNGSDARCGADAGADMGMERRPLLQALGKVGARLAFAFQIEDVLPHRDLGKLLHHHVQRALCVGWRRLSFRLK